MKITETYIVWVDKWKSYVKLHETKDVNGFSTKWFIESNSGILQVHFETALEYLGQKFD